MFRVYDKEKKEWIKNGVVLAPDPDGELYEFKRTLFGGLNLYPVLSDRYVIHREIGMRDKNYRKIYEGDYVKAEVAEDRIVEGLVTFAHEFAGYIILCSDSNEYFTLGSEVSKFVKVIGNVFDGIKENDSEPVVSVNEEISDGQQAL